jgi:hypothetical protein
MFLRGRVLVRIVFGPLAVATFAGVELARFGAFTAAAGAYFVFSASLVAVDLWARWHLRLARRRLAARRRQR